MKRTFEIGHGLTCDLDRLIASRLLIHPEGEYQPLRKRFDYVLAAPKGGDTAAHPRTRIFNG